MKINTQYFQKFKFPKESIDNLIQSSHRDLNIAQNSNEIMVTFMFTYNSIIKISIAYMASKGYKLRSVQGHHRILLETTAELLGKDYEESFILFQDMRRRRNTDLYKGGITITQSEIKEYLKTSENLIQQITNLISENQM